ncbi:serine/threonine-protein kinase [Gemmata sp. JC717]|uniref:serine/threonine-protein kinase n=1 Tax=Gemmata algarum TaxID=2975278 RepID=UPI0021BACCC0|nr:serine/threonine-protein kinase [Gemmata algarum]MDY3552763.1 serine/threonine-protein kinase [Gemmata algarum]
MDETQQSVGGYAIVRKLGEGGMGVVYLATDPRLGRPVALKTLRRDLPASAADRERFLREARAAAAVEHDNIVPVYAIGEAADGTSFIAMPYLRGESLDARLRRPPAVPLDLVLKVADHVASGLAAAHEKGLVHRDIKPANIWLEGDPGAAEPAEQARRCKILDFGLARLADAGDAQITGSGVVLGTPAYMAPEQARGERVDPRADLFSLGVVLYRMATGRPPFRGDTPLSLLVALATDTPAPARAVNPDLPPDLAALIDRLLSKDPDARPRSADEVARAARDIRARLSPGAASTSLPQLLPPAAEPSDSATVPVAPARPPARGTRWAVGAAACLLALAPLVAWRAGAFDGPGSAGTVAQNDAPRTEEPPKPPAEPKAAPENPAPPGKTANAPADPDRAAAMWVLSAGGSVHVNGDGQEIRTAGALPRGPFELTDVLLTAPVKDADLAALAGCRHLTGAYLVGTGITTEGLAHLKGCTELTLLNLSGTAVCDKAVPIIGGFKRLADLSVIQSAVTEAGVKELAKALPGCRIQHNGGTTGPAGKDRP